jgi:Membrane bound O-acyl transferase family
MYLTTYCEGLALAFTTVTGYQTQPVMMNPLFESKSPSDFWGRRWNTIIHTVLKNGVFKPVRKHCSRTTAVVAAFLASGAFHEWLLLAVYLPVPRQLDPITGDCLSSCYTPTYGNAVLFFLWQAALIAIEMMVGGSVIFQQLGKTLPRPAKTALIVAMGIPLAHFFMEPYFRSGFFFLHASPGLPMIHKVQNQ